MKRTLAFLLSFWLLLALLPGTALGEEERFVIRSPEDLERLAERCVLDTASLDLEVILEADLDLSGRELRPIPLFAGHFDGQGHSIRGLRIREAASVTGLFRQLLPGSLVENLSVAGTLTPAGRADRVGGICGLNRGTLRNCAFSGTVSGSRSVGGICGFCGEEALVEGCLSEGSVSGQHQVGGIAGENRGLLLNCENRAAVNTEPPEVLLSEAELELNLDFSPEEVLDITDVGGVAGCSAGTLRGCENSGAVGRLHMGYNIGGLAGRQSGVTENCRNQGPVSGRKDVGGLVGQLDPEARWSFTENRLTELREKLTLLKQKTDELAEAAGEEGSAVSEGIRELVSALERGGTAAEALSEETVQWLDSNLEALNALGSHFRASAEGLEPVMAALTDFTAALPAVTASLEEAFSALGKAASRAGDGLEEAEDAFRAGEAGLGSLQASAQQLGLGLRRLKDGLGDPQEVQAALEAISGGLSGLAEAWGRVEDALTLLSALVRDSSLPSPDELRELVEPLLLSARETLRDAAEDLRDADIYQIGEDIKLRLRENWEDLREADVYQIGEDVELWLRENLEELRETDFRQMGEDVGLWLQEGWLALKSTLGGYLLRLQAAAASRLEEAASPWQALRLLGEGTSRLLAAPDAAELQSFLTGTETAFGSLAAALGSWTAAGAEAREALEQFAGTGDEVSRASGLTSEAIGKLGEALEALQRAAAGLRDLAKQLSDNPAQALTPLPADSEAGEALFSALRDAGSAVSGLSEKTGGVLQEELQAVSDGIYDMIELLLSSLQGSREENGVDVEDVSAAAVGASALVLDCSNVSPVDGESNVGGIVGAISLELSFDREDDWELSSFLSGTARYLIYAGVRGCENEGAVTARRTAAGGIVGRMDYGAAADCASAGDVSTAGDYAGGIAGYSAGALLDCRARSWLSGGNFVGGIAGFGHRVENCLSLPGFAGKAEFQGAIAGDADGPVRGNVYSDSPVGGVNGFSFAEEALPVSYAELRERSGGAAVFETVKVTFLREGESVTVTELPYGGRLESLPQVPDREGQRWRWDPFERDSVKRSLTVEGHYASPISTLSSGEPLPLFLAEGRFYDGQRLRVESVAGEDGEIAHTLTVEGYEGPLTVRMRETGQGEVLRLSPEGEQPLEALRDGSYLVFSLENGGTVTFREGEKSGLPKPLLWIGAGGIPAAGILLLLLRRRRKRRGK